MKNDRQSLKGKIKEVLKSVLKKTYASTILLPPPILRESWLMTCELGYIPNIKNPRSFNEKIARRKLYNDPSVYVELSDKLAVKNWVHEKLGSDYLPKTLQCAKRFEDLRIADLPDSFVIKATHDSGSVVVVDNKRTADWLLIRKFFDTRLGTVYGRDTYESWYEYVTPRLLVEERLWDRVYQTPLDYKFFCFHGEVKLVQVDLDRFGEHTRTLYSPEWTVVDGELKYPRGRQLPPPSCLEKMICVAETLSGDFDFVRIDLYNPSCGRVLFGEMTFAPEAGRGRFRPRQLDFELGGYW